MVKKKTSVSSNEHSKEVQELIIARDKYYSEEYITLLAKIRGMTYGLSNEKIYKLNEGEFEHAKYLAKKHYLDTIHFVGTSFLDALTESQKRNWELRAHLFFALSQQPKPDEMQSRSIIVSKNAIDALLKDLPVGSDKDRMNLEKALNGETLKEPIFIKMPMQRIMNAFWILKDSGYITPGPIPVYEWVAKTIHYEAKGRSMAVKLKSASNLYERAKDKLPSLKQTCPNVYKLAKR